MGKKICEGCGNEIKSLFDSPLCRTCRVFCPECGKKKDFETYERANKRILGRGLCDECFAKRAQNKKNSERESKKLVTGKMREYKVIRDESFRERNNTNTMEQKINELAQEGYRVVSSCAVKSLDSTKIYIFLERET